MAMDPQLGARYRALFHNYGTGRGWMMAELKSRIAVKDRRLREDAMYFLLINLDHMVLQALSLNIPEPYIPEPETAPAGAVMKRYVDDPREALQMALNAFEIIHDGLREEKADPGKEGYSANAVVRAINARSDSIANAILWWRETD
jgi:hypothetical protein